MRHGVDELLAARNPYTRTAGIMAARGFPVSAQVVSTHDKHRHEYEIKPQTKTEKADLAAIISAKMAQTIIAMEPEDMFDRNIQPALGTALKAQAIIDKRELKKPKQNFFIELYMGQREEPRLLEDPNTIEGEAVEVE
jgi:hypothetical protein